MTITQEMVRAYALAYDAEELKELIISTAKQLAENPDMIVSAATGGGASYTRQARIPLSDLLSLYEQAYAYLTGEDISGDLGQAARPVFTRSF